MGGGLYPVLHFHHCSSLVLRSLLDLFDTKCLHRELLTGTNIKNPGGVCGGGGGGERGGTIPNVTLPSLILNCSKLMLDI